MKYVLNIEKEESFAIAKNKEASEFILSFESFSRYGKLKINQLDGIVSTLSGSGKKLILDCDLILGEEELEALIARIEKIDLSHFSSVRVFDPGLMLYFKENSSLKIQILLEMGNHNLSAIENWIEYFGERVDRVVLCPEIPYETIKLYSKKLSCPIETLALGRILLFYTPRKLLSPYFIDHDDKKQKQMLSENFLEVLGHSEESPHKAFSLIESLFGSFMFNPKDLCILDYPKEMLDSGVSFFRCDLRPYESEDLILGIDQYFKSRGTAFLEEVKKQWPNNLIRGFFKANKSDVLFPKLKNTYNNREDDNYIGDVLETLSGEYAVIEIKSSRLSLEAGCVLSFKTPDKKFKKLKLGNIKALSGETLSQTLPGDIIVVPHLSGLSSNTRVYLSQSPDSKLTE